MTRGDSSVGDRALYEAGDQRNYKQSEIREAERYLGHHPEGKSRAHDPNDSKDEESISNRMARAENRDRQQPSERDLDDQRQQIDATLPARSHGNKPSRGAEVDQSLREEEAEELRRKGLQ